MWGPGNESPLFLCNDQELSIQKGMKAMGEVRFSSSVMHHLISHIVSVPFWTGSFLLWKFEFDLFLYLNIEPFFYLPKFNSQVFWVNDVTEQDCMVRAVISRPDSLWDPTSFPGIKRTDREAKHWIFASTPCIQLWGLLFRHIGKFTI